MASSEDFKKLYELYQTEGVPNGVSIGDFCQRNGIVYNQVERWFKKRYSKNETGFHKVRVVGADVEPSVPSLEEEGPAQECSASTTEELSNKPIRLYVSIRTNQGLMIQQNNLTYRQLLLLVEKLEVLC